MTRPTKGLGSVRKEVGGMDMEEVKGLSRGYVSVGE